MKFNIPKGDYFITLTGAKKNIGDFLITYRCERLLEKFQPDVELVKLPHWQQLDKYLDLINNSKGIIIFGGPGYQKNMYPGVYKLTRNLDDIKVPIIPLGLGWKGIPGDFETLQNYRFNDTSLKLLTKMVQNKRQISCRDYYTAQALRNNGIEAVSMTGCPVWYNLSYIGEEMTQTSNIKKIVYTPAQMKEFASQSIDIMKVLKELFPKAEIYCSFHRGIGTKDEFTPDWDVENTQVLAKKATELGLIAVDTAFDLSKIDFYEECDLHVGYRVHAHINFLSMRKPSLLIHEDGRGCGVSEALNINGVDAFERKRSSTPFDRTPKVRGVLRKLSPTIGIKNDCADEVKFQLQSDILNNFIRYVGVNKVIDANFLVMKNYISHLIA